MARRVRCVLTILWLALLVSQGFAFAEGSLPEQDKAKALAHYIVAMTHEVNAESRQALEHYRKSVALDPHQAASRLKLAAYDIRNNRLDEAAAQLKTASQLSPDTYQAHYLLALVYSAQKKFDLAAREYEIVLQKASHQNPLSIEAHAYLAQLYYAQNKHEQAMIQLQEILKLQPRHVAANFLLGSIYLDRDDPIRAVDYLNKVLLEDPDHEGALNALAYSYAQQGIQLNQAHRMARKAIEIDPSNGAYYDTLGWVLYKQRLYPESLMALQKAEALVQEPVVFDHLGDVYKVLNQEALARKAWMKSLQYDANQPRVRQKIQALDKIQALETPQP